VKTRVNTNRIKQMETASYSPEKAGVGSSTLPPGTIWEVDRFARPVLHLLRALEIFQALGIEFVSLTEGVDTSTPAGKMVFTVLGAVAELDGR
jgi:hypothetical protein